MEATMSWAMWAGMWTSIAVSGLLLIPVILEFFKQNLPICFGFIAVLLALYGLTPYSEGARSLWQPISRCPEALWQTIHGTTQQHPLPKQPIKLIQP